MIAANDHVEPSLLDLSAVQLRQLIALAAGLHAHKEGWLATEDVLRNTMEALDRTSAVIPEIVESVAAAHKVSVADLRGQARGRRFYVPRQEAYWRIYETGRVSTTWIGNYFGGRDHTTVMHGMKRHKERNPVLMAAE